MATAPGGSPEEGQSSGSAPPQHILAPEDDHEVEIDVQETGVKNHRFENCKKNPGHANMHLIDDVTLENLPEEWRYPSLFHSIMAVSRTVVKVRVPYVSPNRPDNYPLCQFRGRRTTSFGSGNMTGLIDDGSEPSKDGGIDCPLKNCNIPKPHKTTPIFKVMTSNHVVFDDIEAENATVDFFYDSEKDVGENVVTCHGISVDHSSKRKDRCEMLCVSHDLDLFQKVKTLPPYPSLHNAVRARKPASSLRPTDPLIVIISHPHGHFKHVSFGTCVGYTKKSNDLPDATMGGILDLLEERNPGWAEAGGSTDSGDNYSPQILQLLKHKLQEHSGMDFSEFFQRFCGGFDNEFSLRSIVYTTPTCQASSGAMVAIFLPYQQNRPWVFAGTSQHYRHFDGKLNASGVPSFYPEYAKQGKDAVQRTKDMTRTKERKT